LNRDALQLAAGLLLDRHPRAALGTGDIRLATGDLELPSPETLRGYTDRAVPELTRRAVTPARFAADPALYLTGIAALAPWLYGWVAPPFHDTCALYIYWAFVVDDEIDCNPHLGFTAGAAASAARRSRRRVTRALRRGQAPGPRSPLIEYTRELRALLARQAPDGPWFDRCIGDLAAYVDATATAFDWWQRGETPPVLYYLEQRLHDIGALPATDLIELATRRAVPDRARAHPRFVRTRTLGMLHCAWTNDLYSYEREIKKQGTRWNVVEVLRNQLELSLEDAVDHVVYAMNAAAAEVEDLSWLGELAPEDREPVRLYVWGLRHLMAGWLGYVRSSKRYRAPRVAGAGVALTGNAA
jgi:hypothetical protein